MFEKKREKSQEEREEFGSILVGEERGVGGGWTNRKPSHESILSISNLPSPLVIRNVSLISPATRTLSTLNTKNNKQHQHQHQHTSRLDYRSLGGEGEGGPRRSDWLITNFFSSSGITWLVFSSIYGQPFYCCCRQHHYHRSVLQVFSRWLDSDTYSDSSWAAAEQQQQRAAV